MNEYFLNNRYTIGIEKTQNFRIIISLNILSKRAYFAFV